MNDSLESDHDPAPPAGTDPGPGGAPPGARHGPELIRATKPWSEEDLPRTWRLFGVTVAAAITCGLTAAYAPSAPLAWVASIVFALVNVRIFIFYHDCLHGAVFRRSWLGRSIMKLYGLLILTPHPVWRDSHNYHHAHTSKLVGSSIGSYPLLTVRMYRAARPIDRLLYRAVRSPLTMLFGYLTVFLFGMCLRPLLEKPLRYWTAALSLGVHFGLLFLLSRAGGLEFAARVYLVPLFVSTAVGSYLFFAQHTFPGMELFDRKTWEYSAAALRSSSMMKTGPVLGWFTGDIGYHHVHHLNSQIPFYRLAETMRAVPELQSPAVTSLSPRDIWACLRLDLWDPESKRMLTFAEAERLNRPARSAPAPAP